MENELGLVPRVGCRVDLTPTLGVFGRDPGPFILDRYAVSARSIRWPRGFDGHERWGTADLAVIRGPTGCGRVDVPPDSLDAGRSR